jgi:hypothetical protein
MDFFARLTRFFGTLKDVLDERFGFVGYKNFWQSAQWKTRAYLN